MSRMKSGSRTDTGARADIDELYARGERRNIALQTLKVQTLTVQTLVFAAEVDNGDSGAAATIDWTAGNKQAITLTGTPNAVLAFDSPPGVGNFLLRLIQGAGGSHTVSWPATVKWVGGSTPTLSTGAGDVDIASFYFDGTTYYGVASLDFS